MRWLLCIAFALPLYLLEWLTLPFILWATPFASPKLRWLDGVFGNRVDGTGWNYIGYSKHGPKTPIGWQAITMSGFTGWVGRYFPRFAWLMLRNPINNYLRRCGVRGIIEAYRTYGPLVLARINGRWWWFLYWRKDWGNHYSELKLGYKLWPDQLEVGRRVDAALACSFQPWRKKNG